ncbi:MAG: efflux RND transporter periplasmic adaptor subunit [Candidatus Limisoma sp.]|nr:efflux RND transporter periplasmic adaptor subunit [Candidatus Limisoma sp.]MDY5901131.1 efflux RND transporter periplasmic adaptor subunit [Candidatus Limisoma sp.]MDY6000123.1 efflux RND transporter periplasmic adaptor subunit [Candidatus Limisoma sp.]
MVFAACTPKEETKNDKTDEAVKVEVATGVEREVEETGSYTGTVEAFVTNNIAPQANGRIKKVLVEVGDHVRAGQTIATMDDVSLAQAKLQMDNNELEFNRVDELYKVGGTSKSEWDSKKLALDISRRNYNNLLENTTLVSPISGIVTKRNYDSGDMYRSGEPLYTIEKITPVKLLVNVSESLYTKIKKGMDVDFTLDVYGDELFKAKVHLIYPTIDPATRTFPVELIVANGNERVRPGMFARVIINQGRVKRVLVNDRCIQKLMGSGDRYVYVVKDGVAKYRKVTLGQRFNNEFEILEGLSAGETVVMTGQTRLKDGAKVQIITSKSKESK